ncbi:MAG: TolC family protein, partial [Afipia sp.]|nr:TolC family protein [Afipia sp.]
FRASQAALAPLTIPLLSVRLRLILVAGAAALTSGCAQFSPDGGMSFVSDVARQEMNKDVVALKTADDAASSRAVVDKLLARSL